MGISDYLKENAAFSFKQFDMPMALGHDGRIQKLTVRTPPNNENEFALAKVASKSEKNVA